MKTSRAVLACISCFFEIINLSRPLFPVYMGVFSRMLVILPGSTDFVFLVLEWSLLNRG